MKCIFCGSKVEINTKRWNPDDHGFQWITETRIKCQHPECGLEIVSSCNVDDMEKRMDRVDAASFRILDRLRTVKNQLDNILKDSPNSKIYEVVNVVNDLGRIIHGLNLSLTAINERKKKTEANND